MSGSPIWSGLGWFGPGLLMCLWSAGVTCSGLSSTCSDSAPRVSCPSGTRKQAQAVTDMQESQNIFSTYFMNLLLTSIWKKRITWSNPESRGREVFPTQGKQTLQSPMGNGLGHRERGLSHTIASQCHYPGKFFIYSKRTEAVK